MLSTVEVIPVIFAAIQLNSLHILGQVPTSASDTDNRIPLYLGGFFSFSGPWDGSGVLPAVEMALDHINQRTDVLAEYELKMVWNDTQCSSGLGTRVFIDQLYSKPQKIILIGPGCSIDAQPVAEISHYWNLITVSYTATSPALSNRDKYPYFYRAITPALALNLPIIRLMKEFDWNRVATIHQNHELFSLSIENFISLVKASNLTMVSSETIAKDPHVSVENLKRHDAKIIFVSMYQDMGRKIFCEAYKQDMMRAGYVWIIYGWWSGDWWIQEDNTIECTPDEMNEAVSSTTMLIIDWKQLSTKEEQTISGLTPQELVSELDDRMEWPEYNRCTRTAKAPFGYDAAWAIALMLNKTSEALKKKVFSNEPQSRRLEDFTYEDDEMVQMFFDLLKDSNFDGMTGHVAFKDGDRLGDTTIAQLQGNVKHPIASYSIELDILELENDIIWKDDYLPIDHTAIVRLYQGISQYLFIIISVSAGVGIFIACIFLAFNLKYRTQKTVKMSSPYLNNIIIIGSILIYASVIISGLDSNVISINTFAATCQIRAWLLSTGFVLGFGSMFSKTWRVYRVAALKTPKRRILTDKHLFIMVFVFFCIDVIVLTLWQIIDPIYVVTIDLYERMDPHVTNGRIVPYIEQCTSDYLVYWMAALYAYKGLLLLFGTFLAWETKKVTIPALNDSKLIGICVYNTVVLCIVGVSVSFLITNDTSALYIFTSSIIIFCATVTLVVLFVPKIISVYKYPEGVPISTMKSVSGDVGMSKDTMSSTDKCSDDDMQRKLRDRVQELEKKLKERGNDTSGKGVGCGLWCGNTVSGCCSQMPEEAEVVGNGTTQHVKNQTPTSDINTV
ncbi:gamma-aminobutyric acid type B receptor subunit 1-like [Amphiura filiformis]|uniref:gamma-aminobutyric acid type B receptor subunit 1-like n=1 Tax=Amphiura filiformis TaxID=82378 RepID=UPI003B2125BF